MGMVASKSSKKLKFAVAELKSTEESFHTSFKQLLENKDKIQELCDTVDSANSNIIRRILQLAERVDKSSQEFQKSLEDIQEGTSATEDRNTVIAAFAKAEKDDLFYSYVDYAVYYEKHAASIRAFSEAEKKLGEKRIALASSEGKDNSLASLFMMPVQRVMRYEMPLKEMKNANDSLPEKEIGYAKKMATMVNQAPKLFEPFLQGESQIIYADSALTEEDLKRELGTTISDLMKASSYSYEKENNVIRYRDARGESHKVGAFSIDTEKKYISFTPNKALLSGNKDLGFKDRVRVAKDMQSKLQSLEKSTYSQNALKETKPNGVEADTSQRWLIKGVPGPDANYKNSSFYESIKGALAEKGFTLDTEYGGGSGAKFKDKDKYLKLKCSKDNVKYDVYWGPHGMAMMASSKSLTGSRPDLKQESVQALHAVRDTLAEKMAAKSFRGVWVLSGSDIEKNGIFESRMQQDLLVSFLEGEAKCAPVFDTPVFDTPERQESVVEARLEDSKDSDQSLSSLPLERISEVTSVHTNTVVAKANKPSTPPVPDTVSTSNESAFSAQAFAGSTTEDNKTVPVEKGQEEISGTKEEISATKKDGNGAHSKKRSLGLAIFAGGLSGAGLALVVPTLSEVAVIASGMEFLAATAVSVGPAVGEFLAGAAVAAGPVGWGVLGATVGVAGLAYGAFKFVKNKKSRQARAKIPPLSQDNKGSQVDFRSSKISVSDQSASSSRQSSIEHKQSQDRKPALPSAHRNSTTSTTPGSGLQR